MAKQCFSRSTCVGTVLPLILRLLLLLTLNPKNNSIVHLPVLHSSASQPPTAMLMPELTRCLSPLFLNTQALRR